MSVFTVESLKCNICKVRDREVDSSRCGYCKKRYDASGNPFIIAADIYKFHKKGHIVYIWVCDQKVKTIKSSRPGAMEDLINQDKYLMMDYMRSKDYEFVEMNESLI